MVSVPMVCALVLPLFVCCSRFRSFCTEILVMFYNKIFSFSAMMRSKFVRNFNTGQVEDIMKEL